MAATAIAGVSHYIGTAAERAALSTTGIPAGSTFYETDTPALYIFDGSNWSEHIATVQTGDTINIASIEGKDAAGAAVTGKPVTIGIKDSSNNARTVSDSNPLPAKLTGSKEKLVVNYQAPATNIAAAASETVTINATSGYLAKVLSMYLRFGAAPGGASGTHSLTVKLYNGTATAYTLLSMSAAYNVALQFSMLDDASGTLTIPKTADLLQNFIRAGSLEFGDTAALKMVITYTNNTDVLVSGGRTYYIVSHEKAVIS